MQRSPVLFRRKRRILRIRGLLLAVARGNCCSHRFNRAGLGLCWCCFPTRISKPHIALHRTSCGFVSQNEVAPPPLGGGAGITHLSWIGQVGFVRSKLDHAGSTGPTLFLAGIVPLPGLQNRTQGHTGPSLVLSVFSWGALGLVALPNLVPACKLSPPGWGGW